MIQSAETVLQNLAKKIYEPIYFLQGEEVYYLDAITRHIEEQLLTPAEKGFNLSIFYGKECSMAALLTQARRFPMGADKQIVIVKEAQEMADLKNATGQQLLLHYLHHPQLTTLLVFAYKYKTIDGRSTFSKVLNKNTVLVTSKKLYNQQLPTFIKSFVKTLELSITEKAIWMLQACIGNDLTRIVNELHKLRLNLNTGNTITDSIVETYIDLSKPFNVFELQKAIMQKDYPKSYQIISICALNAKEHAALPIITILYIFFSKLLLLHQTKETDPAKISKHIEIHPYFVQGYLDARRHYPLHQILQNITYLHQADVQVKGIDCNTNDYQVMKELIFKLMHA
ncbi:DNA polymerase III subunit delta [Candidatus Cardinium hertigii]|jgi:DNA polymerase-3 subunit delta|uniref:DNA polymerase III subunit delta n=1 Tax=Candidatus Cardinium hertigii TaxID=247481 RepID=A0A3N2QCD5_9BACT|nr:DNA polymerase III subunit delta [Candidatus Cardinium hertigii]ROT47440.1 DNA polymerase III subunit delta [Candidatus Cardinium hertigii]ROT47444.1 DNA polymerase III subunit delta [Candidatus Cardinium hertigii]ROT47852.1 DNA polymerase III subunit delta [Candidatus Cardinium hertigii]